MCLFDSVACNRSRCGSNILSCQCDCGTVRSPPVVIGGLSHDLGQVIYTGLLLNNWTSYKWSNQMPLIMTQTKSPVTYVHRVFFFFFMF